MTTARHLMAAIMAQPKGRKVANVADPSNLTLSSTFNSPNISGVTSLFADGKTVYAFRSGAGFVVVDAEDATDPDQLGANTSQRPVAGASRNGIVYAFREDTLYSIDVRNPTEMVLLDSITVPEVSTSNGKPVLLGGVLIAPSSSNGQVFTVDISDPSSLSILDTLSGITDAQQVSVVEDLAYVVGHTSNTIYSIDISDPSNLALLDSLSTLSGPYSVSAVEGYAFVANFDDDEIAVIDCSDPSNLSSIGSFSNIFTSQAYSVEAFGGVAYVGAAGSNDVTSWDVSNPSSPAFLDRVPSVGYLVHLGEGQLLVGSPSTSDFSIIT